MLAEYLDLPSVSGVSGMNFSGENLVFNRDVDGGFEEVTIPSPVVAIVQKGIAKEARIPAMRGIMMARKKPLKVLQASGMNGFTKMNSFGELYLRLSSITMHFHLFLNISSFEFSASLSSFSF